MKEQLLSIQTKVKPKGFPFAWACCLFFLGSSTLSTLHAQIVLEVTTVAGTPYGVNSKDGTGKLAAFRDPSGVITDAAGNIYVGEFYGNKVRKVTPSGVVTTIAGNGSRISVDGQGVQAGLFGPSGMAFDKDSNLIVAETEAYKIRKISRSGEVTTLAGSGKHGLTDGKGTDASFGGPTGLVIDASGNIIVADHYGNLLRKITPDGTVSTLSARGYGDKDGPISEATFNRPRGLAIDKLGNIYVADRDNHKIRKISPSGIVSTFAGSGVWGYADKQGKEAQFHSPLGVAVDDTGNVYVADGYNHRIRKISPTGMVSTLAGNGIEATRDGLALQASYKYPMGVALDRFGNIYTIDNQGNVVQRIAKQKPAPPEVKYQNLSGSLCIGSTVNEDPVISGSDIDLTITADSSRILSNIKDLVKGSNGEFYAITGVDGQDSILHYNSAGVVVDTTIPLTHMKKICPAPGNKVYIFTNEPGSESIQRMNSTGFPEFGSQYKTLTSQIIDVIDMKVGSDGFLYASDSIYGLQKIDTSDFTNVSTLNIPFGANQPFTISFGKGEIYLFNKVSHKVYVSSFPNIGSYNQAFPWLDSLGFAVESFDFDTAGLGSITVMNTSQNKLVKFDATDKGFDKDSKTVYSDFMNMNGPKGFVNNSTTNTVDLSLWVATSSNKLLSSSLYYLTITPPLPAGLSFNAVTKRIMGSPKVQAPAATYIITSQSTAYGTQTDTLRFSVDPPGPISNAIASKTAEALQSDGLTVNYFEKNNCEQLMTIADKPGGGNLGRVEVKQEVSPTILSFNSSSFNRRVTEVNSENDKVDARVKLYFTYLDVEHFNSTNGSNDVDLNNDTTGGTMQVGVLQKHTNKNGIDEYIKHNPIAAKWIKEKKAWEVDFSVTKFSTFYMGESNTVGNFNCITTGPTDKITSCGYYFWRGKVYTKSGIYKDTTANHFGCDSIISLDLTVKNDFEITQDQLFPETMSCNTTGATYQWINCDNGGTDIDGATSKDFTATVNGNYAVVATYNSCTDTSLCVSITHLDPSLTGLNDTKDMGSLAFYPNPSGGVYTLNTSGNYVMMVYNLLGEKILEESNGNNVLDLTSYPKGIYFVNLQLGNTTKKLKLMKQ